MILGLTTAINIASSLWIGIAHLSACSGVVNKTASCGLPAEVPTTRIGAVRHPQRGSVLGGDEEAVEVEAGLGVFSGLRRMVGSARFATGWLWVSLSRVASASESLR